MDEAPIVTSLEHCQQYHGNGNEAYTSRVTCEQRLAMESEESLSTPVREYM